MRISDWSSDVCSSDLQFGDSGGLARPVDPDYQDDLRARKGVDVERFGDRAQDGSDLVGDDLAQFLDAARHGIAPRGEALADRSEEHTSELQSLMRTSYAVFCLKKKRPPQPQPIRRPTAHHTERT